MYQLPHELLSDLRLGSPKTRAFEKKFLSAWIDGEYKVDHAKGKF